MTTSLSLILIGLIIFLGFFFRRVFEEKNIPDILGLIGVGLLLGPAFNLITPSDFGQFGPLFSNITLLWILFNSGINLKLKEVISTFNISSGITIVGFLVTAALVTIVCVNFLNLSLLEAMFVGTALGGTNSAVVTGMVGKLGIRNSTKTILVMESVETDIFTLAFPIAILNYMLYHKGSTGSVLIDFVFSIALSLLLGYAGALIWSIIVNNIRLIKQTQFSNLAFLFVIYGFAEYVNINGPLVALTFGITIGNLSQVIPVWLEKFITDEKIVLLRSEKKFYDQIEFILRAFFFTYVGISIKIDNPSLLKWGLIIAVLIFLARILVVRFVIKKETPLLDKAAMSILIAKGLGAAVMAGLPAQKGYLNGESMQAICYSLILFSTVVCSLLFWALMNRKSLAFYQLFFGKSAT